MKKSVKLSLIGFGILILIFGISTAVSELSVTRLTNSPGIDYHADWSPDGTKLAFISERAGNFDIWVMNSDGSGLSQLTTSTARDSEPFWSPDGTKISFYSDRTGSPEIWIMNADGTGKKQITNDGKINTFPSWSPDGRRFAYVVGENDNRDIWIMNIDGTGKQQLTIDSAPDYQPFWSPDGTRIAFTSKRTGNYDIWVINEDGTGLKQLTHDSGNNRVPTWKAGKIAVQSDRSGNWDIWLMDDNGENPVQLTTNPAEDRCPFLSPDASKLTFCSLRADQNNREIFLMDISSITSSNPKIVVLANSIDYGLASDFFGFLQNKGIDVTYTTADDFEQYKNEKFIVILGGPDAYEGVGEIAQEALSEAEQDSIREAGARKKYTKTNIWAQDQSVTVLAGSDRNETKKSHEDNRDQVALEVGT